MFPKGHDVQEDVEQPDGVVRLLSGGHMCIGLSSCVVNVSRKCVAPGNLQNTSVFIRGEFKRC